MKVYTFTRGAMNTNTYFCVAPDNTCVVIDPGMDGEAIFAKLCEKNLKPTHILLTHGHFDHVMGARFLKEKTGAVICVHSKDAEMLYRPAINSCAFYFHGDLSRYPCVHADRLLEEGKATFGALSFDVMHTPGHTAGSVAFMAQNFIFCGDTIFAYGYGRYDLYGANRADLYASLQRYLALEGEYKLCPGHGNSVSLSRAKELIPDYLNELQG